MNAISYERLFQDQRKLTLDATGSDPSSKLWSYKSSNCKSYLLTNPSFYKTGDF